MLQNTNETHFEGKFVKILSRPNKAKKNSKMLYALTFFQEKLKVSDYLQLEVLKKYLSEAFITKMEK